MSENENGSNTRDNLNLIHDHLECVYENIPLTEDTTCGFGIFRGSFFQRFANQNAYVLLYGLVGCIFSATYAYFKGIITTLEKRFKIPSRHMGIIAVGNDISALFVSAILSYYAGKGHRPRWIAFGLIAIVIFCLLSAFPHLMYGSGKDALSLTIEYGASFNDSLTHGLLEADKQKLLCRKNSEQGIAECEMSDVNWTPLGILFLAQLIAGVGGCLYYTLGVSYMDDNIKKSRTPALISLSYFVRMFGPAFGYALASLCLKLYISPSLRPTITINDPRWLGAWWLGWIILAIILFLFAFVIALFPKTLPQTVIHKNTGADAASFADMMETFKRLVKNKTFMLNNTASIFYFFGYMPYWIFTPKYIEIQFRQSASVSSLVTGTVVLAFSAIGVLLSGFMISKYQPKARQMAAWNVFVGALSVIGIVAYVFLGCSANDGLISKNNLQTCNIVCPCDYVRYAPVCGSNGNTYISACHAGCTRYGYNNDGGEIFSDCECIEGQQKNFSISRQFGTATPGSCTVNCFNEFLVFLIVMCLLNFTGATGRVSNFLVSVRCVEQTDKPVSMGFGIMLLSLFSLIPSPIVFGAILDKTCLVWGKTCTGTGNCWLYDGVTLRYLLNLIAAVFVTIGTLFDIGVWYYVKDLKIFDDDADGVELIDIDRDCKTEVSEVK